MRKKVVIILVLIIISMFCNLNYIEAKDDVSDRELALACALTYTPTFCTQSEIKNGQCSLKDVPAIVNDINSYVNVHNYGTAKELYDWKLVDYVSEATSKNEVKLTMEMNAYTFIKGDNVVILFRGTDFADLFEWIQHLTYVTTNIHEQETHAENYILKQAAKYKDKKIYITGHSLGGYLADVASATLLKAKQLANEKESWSADDWAGFNLYTKKNGNKVYDISSYKIEDYKNLNFVRSASFNGMGFLFDASPENIDNSVQKIKLDIINNNRENENSSTEVIDYSINGDVVSSLGIRPGEIRIMDAPIDSVTFHHDNYKWIKDNAKKVLSVAIDNNVLMTHLKKEMKDYASANADAIAMLKNVLESKSSDLLGYVFKNDVIDTYKYYQMDSLIAYVHLTHETDGFICLQNEDSIKKADLRVEKFYNNQITSHKDYISNQNNDVLAYSSTGDKEIRAITKNACARKYEWYSCTDKTGDNCTSIQENSLESDNKNNKITIKVDNNIKYYKVKSYINDDYKTGKITSSNNKFIYEKSEESINHLSAEKEKVFGMIVDKEAPKCKANITSFTKKVDCKQTLVITCTDNIGLQNDKITIDNISGSLKDKLSISIQDEERVNNVKQSKIVLYLNPKNITLIKKKLNITVQDIAGNKTTVTVKGKINLNLFNKKCN